jgi:diguanylate cyclase (GGDEF)-like protein/PAS domain S-box-containing protein
MVSSAATQLGSVLQDRRDVIAEHWREAIGRTGFVGLSAREVGQRLAALVDQVITLLLTDAPDRLSSRQIGATLADLYYAHPQALSGTQEVLGRELAVGLSHEQEREVWPRLTLLLSEMAAGFLERARETVLAEQESILGALLTARNETQEALRESEARFRAIFDAAAIGIGIGDIHGRILQTNRALQAMFGYSGEEMQSRVVAQFMHPDDVASVWRLYEELVAGRRNHFQTEKRYFRKDGQTIWCHLTVSLVRDAAGLPQLQIAMIRNITERKQAEEALRRNEERFRALVQNSTDAIVVFGVDGAIHYQSPATERILGAPLNDLIDAVALGRLHADDAPRVRSLVADLIETPGSEARAEFRFRHHDGTWRWLEAILTNLLADPSVGGIVANVRDITDRKRFEEQLKYEALHDSLTGLPNRVLFNDRLARALSSAAPRCEPITVLLVDLDHFKIINDSLGHEAGDQALITVARRLRECLSAGNTVARLGGDEFAILLEGLTQDAAVTIAERILASLREPVRVLGRDAVVSASVGVAECNLGLDLPSDLLRAADIALYRAKAEGRSAIAVFEPSMQAHALARLELEANLMPAIERGQFELYFQPEIELTSGRIVCFEALVRWNRPGYGVVEPGDFVPLAEETGLILPLGQWVLTEACRSAREWMTLQPGRPPVAVSVNLSARQLRQSDLVAQVARVLAETGLDTHLLRLEVTERALVEDLSATDAALRDLRRRGVRIAIDDFGTGYSSLLYLRRLAVDSIKIDQSFVRGLGTFDQDRAIVQAVTALVHTLDMDVTAEGIETAAQLMAAMEVGCDRGQGYYFARPGPAGAVADLLARPSFFESVRIGPNGVTETPPTSVPNGTGA